MGKIKLAIVKQSRQKKIWGRKMENRHSQAG